MSKSFRKINEQYENPYDNLMINLSEKVSGNFREMNFTPNQITTISLVFSLISAIFLMKIDNTDKAKNTNKNLNKTVAIIFYLLSYFFDCLDGYYARKYDMVTDLGDKYDHYTDIIKCLIFYRIFYLKLSRTKFYIYTIIILILIMIMFIQLGCQEKYYTKNGNENGHFLENFKLFCFNSPEKTMKFTKYFGCGTNILVTSIFMMLI